MWIKLLTLQRGQGLVEYGLILLLVSIGAIVVLGTLSGTINLLFGSITGSV